MTLSAAGTDSLPSDSTVAARSGSTVAHPLLDDVADLSALRAKGADPDELFADFAAWAEAGGTMLYPGAPIIACAAEVLANIALREGSGKDGITDVLVVASPVVAPSLVTARR